MDIKTIDPALGAMKEFSKVAAGTVVQIAQMRQKVLFSDGVLTAKVKTLAALLWAVSARCEPCVKFYAAKAVELGASQEELGEMLAVASTMGGCVGETWAVKAFAATQNNGGDPACCEVE